MSYIPVRILPFKLFVLFLFSIVPTPIDCGYGFLYILPCLWIRGRVWAVIEANSCKNAPIRCLLQSSVCLHSLDSALGQSRNIVSPAADAASSAHGRALRCFVPCT